MALPSRLKPTDKVVIVGAGVFGLSTARELSNRGYKNITVLDRYPPPVPDGTSVDISRIIRPDYADEFYSQLAQEALEAWEGEYRPFFYKAGFLGVAHGKSHPYLSAAKTNLEALNKTFEPLDDNKIRERFPALHGDLSNFGGYLNAEGGWANAEESITYIARQCAKQGVSFVSGKRGTVTGFLIGEQGVITGLQTLSQVSLEADFVIMATGAWSPHLLNMDGISVSASQPVGFMQLTAEETKEMEGCPVVMDFSSGVFMFPPLPGINILKLARHGYGYEASRKSHSHKTEVSAPDLLHDNAASHFIPDDAEKALRGTLSVFLPKFKDRPFFRSRLCWYTDTRRGDFVVDYHTDYKNLFVATGGSGQ